MSEWSRGEIEVVAAAAQAAPSVHNTQPWLLEFHDDGAHGVSLFERLDRALPRHDPRGRDRLISCGAALQNLELAMRVLGWPPDLTLQPTAAHPDEVAMASSANRLPPSDVDLERYAAIPRRKSYRHPFAHAPIRPSTRDELVAAPGVDGVEVRAVRDGHEIDVLARVLEHAALVLKSDRAYQRELSAWTAKDPNPLAGKGVAPVSRRLSTLPWAGLVRRFTAVPERGVLAERLGRQCLLIVETPDDGRADQLRAGMAAEAVWLAATATGLAGSLLTQPLQVREVRAGLIEGLELAGFPQALMRFGHPAEPPQPRTESTVPRESAKEDPS